MTNYQKSHIFDLLSPHMTPYATSYALYMIILSFRHSIVYVTLRNWIQCIDAMAVMSKICENSPFWVFFNWFLDLWRPIADFGLFCLLIFGPLKLKIWPRILSRHSINDYFVFGQLNHVCINDKFHSMYGWYIPYSPFLVIFDIFSDI